MSEDSILEGVSRTTKAGIGYRSLDAMGSNQEVHNTPKLSHLLLIIDTHIALSCRQKGILAHFIYRRQTFICLFYLP